jgi:hypothetical protein
VSGAKTKQQPREGYPHLPLGSVKVEVSSRGGDVGVGGAGESGGDGESQDDADEVLRGRVVCCRRSRVVGLAGLRSEE